MEGRYAFHVWFDGCAVFDRLSGDSHVLDVFAAMLFLSALKASAEVIEGLRPPEISPETLASAFADAQLRLEKLRLPYPRLS
jgi:hypothetical protein